MEWVTINPEDIRSRFSKRRLIAGGEAEFSPSPYDIPQALRVLHRDEDKCFIIEMRYLTQDEKTVELEFDESVSAEIGKASGRIYKLIISLEVLKRRFGPLPNFKSLTDAMLVATRDAIKSWAVGRLDNVAFNRYDLPSDAIKSSERNIMRELQTHSLPWCI
jgi:hypothetical protein